MKRLNKTMALFFVAASMLIVSCEKDDTNPHGNSQNATITEAEIIGTWLFPADHVLYKGKELNINADHTASFPGSYTYSWTLSGNELTATCQVSSSIQTLTFSIQNVTETEMTFVGTEELDGVTKDISCTLTKISVPLEKLPEIIVGTWSANHESGNQMFYDITLNADGTASQEVGIEENGTWTLNGTTLTVSGQCQRYDGIHNDSYTIDVSKIQRRDGKYKMKVSGYHVHSLNGEEQSNFPFEGYMTRAI